MAGGREECGQRQRHDDREIEQDRRRGGGGETLQRIEDAAIERDQRDQQQIGKGDAGQIDRERIAAGIVAQSPAPAHRSPPA